MKIEDIDKNFKPSVVGNTEVHYFDALKKPFSLEGFPWRKDGEELYRIPKELTKDDVNEGVLYLSHNTAGGAIRFRTDSPLITLRAKLAYSADMNHMPRAGSAGFDIYRGKGTERYHVGTAQPGRDQEILELIIATNDKGDMEEWLLNLPLYGGAESIELGFAPGSNVEEPAPHHITKPILFYGSSITQGGCASRPGNAYTSMLCRAVDAEQINLGFSGSGRGEQAIAEAIAGIKLSAFVMDYDHNAPNAEHLQATHEKFFRIIREKQPELPIIFMSKCDIWPYKEYEIADKRRAIIRTTYENALKTGDKNVYFIDGETLFGQDNRTDCTVDTCHPNDLGFYRMFENTLPALKKALNKNEKS